MSDQIDLIKHITVHSIEIKHLQDDNGRIIEDIKEVKKRLITFDQMLSEVKGGWRLVLIMGGTGAALVEALQWAVQHLGK
jgi:hypothetical protein